MNDIVKNNLPVIDKIILYTVLGITAIGIIWAYFHFVVNAEDVSKRILRETKDLNFNGRVDSIYFEERNHNTMVIVLQKGYTYEVYKEWVPLIELGDSLSKSRGALKFILYKKDKRKLVLDFKKIAKDREWDVD